ncbi:unnamed protein product [Nippostrongylus brasiliensis]|uniref:BZIP domain-containing protein n=1 Tax=Nippostrongylus brasiliensis TaxID=27835 RepID=A0A0N4Y8K1_NIPBR|nr:unnamed protein product [Nippostrongylus brasiliensis]
MKQHLFQPLSAEESSRFEDLSKVYFEDFYAVPYVLRAGSKGQPQQASRSDQLFEFDDDLSNKREVATPTDEDLAELLADVSKEGGQLDRLTCGGGGSGAGAGGCGAPSDLEPLPLVNNVMSEMSMLQEQRQAAMSAMLTPPAPATLYNESSMPGVWMQQVEMSPSDIYPNNGFMSFQNDTAVPVVSTGSQYDHQYHNGVQQQETTQMYDPYYSARTTSFSNESLSVCSSSSNAASPHYHSETENYSPHASRYFGKLAPREVEDTTALYPRTVCGSNGENGLSTANNNVVSVPRRRKNKVAARTCRERRGERQRTSHGTEASWNVPTHTPEPPYQIHL